MSVGAGCERYLTEAVSMACVVGVVMCLFETGGLLFCLVVLFWFVLGKIQAWVVLCIAPPPIRPPFFSFLSSCLQIINN